MADFEIGYSNQNLVVVETPVTIGDEDFTFKTPDEFYDEQQMVFEENEGRRYMKEPLIEIRTAAPNISRLVDEMVNILESGKDAIYVSTASTLTSAFESGRNAVDIINEDYDFKNKAIVIDGLSMSALTSVLVQAALESCDTTKEFLYYIFCRRNDTEHFFAVEEWEAFRNSGRISNTTLLIAKIGHFKPLMRFDFLENGERKAFCEKKDIRFRNLMRYAAKALDETIDESVRFCTIIHAQNPEGATMLRDEVLKLRPNLNIRFNLETCRMGPATGVHLGHSAVGLAFMRRPRTYPNAELHRNAQLTSNAIYGYELDLDGLI
jgi:DegV family protein with EDD domain